MKRGAFFGPRRVRVGCFVVQDPLFLCAALYLLLYFDGGGFLRIGLLAAILHECGHILVFYLMKRRLPRILVGITGLCMRTRGAGLTPGQTFLLAAAGPGMNLLLAGIWYGRICIRATLWDDAFLAANLLLAGFNLLPIPPLDGARMIGAARDFVRNKRQK